MTRSTATAAAAMPLLEHDQDSPDMIDPALAKRARPVPRIAIQAFCEDQGVANVLHAAAQDRRLLKAQVSLHMGGAAAALAHYRDHPTPGLIILESLHAPADMLSDLDQLAQFCDPGTKVMVIGHRNDVPLYRELLRRGVSEYLVMPVSPLQVIEAISGLYADPEAAPVGQVIAFVGAKGGVGSSTICHNVSWILAEQMRCNVVIADLDLAFGTTGLDFDQDPVQGIADALATPERLDEVLLDRLLTKCSERLSIFAAPVVLDRDYDLSADACDTVLEVVRQNVPFVTVDLPHTWSAWCKRVLTQADEVVITAEPDLANLRNAKNLIDLLKSVRRNDNGPRLILNRVGMPKRPEIAVKEFEQNVGLKAMAVVEFDVETFGQASINGRMVEELSPKAASAQVFRSIAHIVTNRREAKPERKAPSGAAAALAPFLERLRLKR